MYDDALLRIERIPDIIGMHDAPCLSENDPEAWHVQVNNNLSIDCCKWFSPGLLTKFCDPNKCRFSVQLIQTQWKVFQRIQKMPLFRLVIVVFVYNWRISWTCNYMTDLFFLPFDCSWNLYVLQCRTWFAGKMCWSTWVYIQLMWRLSEQPNISFTLRTSISLGHHIIGLHIMT